MMASLLLKCTTPLAEVMEGYGAQGGAPWPLMQPFTKRG